MCTSSRRPDLGSLTIAARAGLRRSEQITGTTVTWCELLLCVKGCSGCLWYKGLPAPPSFLRQNTQACHTKTSRLRPRRLGELLTKRRTRGGETHKCTPGVTTHHRLKYAQPQAVPQLPGDRAAVPLAAAVAPSLPMQRTSIEQGRAPMSVEVCARKTPCVSKFQHQG